MSGATVAHRPPLAKGRTRTTGQNLRRAAFEAVMIIYALVMGGYESAIDLAYTCSNWSTAASQL